MVCRFVRGQIPGSNIVALQDDFPLHIIPAGVNLAENPALKIAKIQIAEKMVFLFKPSRYKVAYGGRGGVKSWSFARTLLIRGAQEKLRILCAREFQASIKESVHQLLTDQISLTGLEDYYHVMNTEIRGATGTEFIFAGLKNNVTKIKSMEGIDIVWVEEAEKVSENSWMVLIPTIRKDGSEIWVSFNPHQESDPTYKRFIISPPPNSIVVETGWKDNPWLPKELQAEKDYLARVDKDAYDHVWGGEVQRRSNVQVMHDKCFLEAFEPGEEWNGPYYGADWGFASDPAVLIKKWIFGRTLYIEEEFWGIGVDIDLLPDRFGEISGAREHVIRADNSRPETISYMKQHGFPRIIPGAKWEGCVEDGISFLRAFERIVIHPRCVHMDEESRTYKHKVDPLTGDILPDIVDKNNHCWDSVRYGLEPLIKARATPGLFFTGVKAPKKVADKAEELVPLAEAIKGGQKRDRAMERWMRGD